MKLRTCLFAVIVMLLPSHAAFAWNCSDPLAARVDVGTTQPSGSSGSGDNQWFKGTGSEGIAGDYYVCEVPKTPPTSGGSNSNSNANTNSNSNSNSNKNLNSNSATGGNSNSSATGGNSNSNSNSNSNATGGSGGNSSSTANGGAGGNATGGNSNATGGSVNGSGNSSNTNTAQGGQGGAGGQGGTGGQGGNATGGNATGGNANQGQKQGQSQSSSNTNTSALAASNNGNGSNNASYSSETNIAAPKMPVSTAYAPTTLPTSPCTKGFSAGLQTLPFGGSFGANTVDKNCVILEAARNAPNILAFCKVYVTHKAVKAAGVTLADCIGPKPDPPQPVVIEKRVEVPVVVEKPVEVIKTVEVPVEVPRPFDPQLVGICTFASQFQCDLKTKTPSDPLHVTTICDDMLRQAITLQRNNPGTVIKLIGNENDSEKLSSSMYSLARAKNVQRRLVALGALPGSIAVETGKTGDRTVEVWVIAK
jgi:hypothetical protein